MKLSPRARARRRDASRGRRFSPRAPRAASRRDAEALRAGRAPARGAAARLPAARARKDPFWTQGWFKGMNWGAMGRRELPPPLDPPLAYDRFPDNCADTQHFDAVPRLGRGRGLEEAVGEADDAFPLRPADFVCVQVATVAALEVDAARDRQR